MTKADRARIDSAVTGYLLRSGYHPMVAGAELPDTQAIVEAVVAGGGDSQERRFVRRALYGYARMYLFHLKSVVRAGYFASDEGKFRRELRAYRRLRAELLVREGRQL